MCLSVNNFCCCCTLNVGTKIISIMCTITAAATVLVYGTASAVELRLPPGRLIFYTTMAAIGMLQFVFGCLLIYGAFTRSPRFTWPWTILTWFKSLCLIGVTVTGIVLLNYNRKLEQTAQISTVISAYFVYAITLFYFASVVNSRRQQMLIENRTETAKRLMRHRVLPNYYV